MIFKCDRYANSIQWYAKLILKFNSGTTELELITPPLSVKISQLFSLGFYSFEISDKSRSGVLFFEVKIA